MNPVEKAMEIINGKTSDEIAAMLRKHKVEGRPGTVGNCPLANLFHALIGGDFIVGPKYIMRRSNGKAVDRATTPKTCADFIRKFDLSKYPDLIAPPPRVLRPHVKARVRKPPWRSGKRRARGKVVNHPAFDVGRWPGIAKGGVA